MCDQLLSRSLRIHGLDEIPEHGSQVAQWLENSLRPELEETIGVDAADLLLTQLAPMAAYAALNKPRVLRAGTPTPARGNVALAHTVSDFPSVGGDGADRAPTAPLKRPTRNTSVGYAPGFEAPPTDREPTRPFRIFDEAPATGVFEGVERVTLMSEPDNANELRRMAIRTLPPPTDPPALELPEQFDESVPQEPSRVSGRQSAFVTLPVVLAATRDESRLRALETYLEGTAAVAQITDLASLLDAFASPIRTDRLLLIDCMRPSVHVNTVAAIRQDLPRGTTVVVWGINEATWSALEREKTSTTRWVRCSQEAGNDDVGSLCAMLLG